MFLSVALVTKKLWAILDFFSQTRLFFRPVPYPINKKKITRNPLNYDLLKVTQFHGDSVKNKSARTIGVNKCVCALLKISQIF